MALYRVTWNGQDILDYTNERMVLLSPHHENELNMAGSLRFVVPTRHLYYDMFTPDSILISDVEIYEDGELIWFGRPIQLRKDFFNQKEIYCEGALGFFNDSIQEKSKFEGSVHEFFKQVLADHNFQVDTSRRILPGNITVDDKSVYREPNYEKTIDVLRGQCLETNDGYFFLRKENGAVYIDWLKDMPFTCNQTIEFAENMLNVSSTFDGSDYATCVMPLGAQNDVGDPINIYDINNHNHILESEMAQIYGRIVQVVQFSDIDDPYELMEEGKKALERIQYNSHIIECSAADLHSSDGSKEMFRVGQMVHCYSEPHELEIDLPLSKMELDLDTAAKQITLGIIPKKTLTRISKQKEKQAETYSPGSISGEGGSYIDDEGIDWEIIMPTEPGGAVTAIKMPTRIEIAREPNKTEYEPGEDIDFTGLLVNIWSGDKIWTNPPSYIDGRAPMSELSFSTRTAPSGQGIEGFSVAVTWKYKGKSFSTTLGLTVEPSHDWDIDLQLPLVDDYFYRPIKIASEFQQVFEIVDSWNQKKGQVRVAESISNGYFVVGKGQNNRTILAFSTDPNAVIRTTRTVISGDLSPDVWNFEYTSGIGSMTRYTLLGTAYHSQLGRDEFRFTQGLNPPVDNELKKPISLSDNFWNQLATLVLDGGPA